MGTQTTQPPYPRNLAVGRTGLYRNITEPQGLATLIALLVVAISVLPCRAQPPSSPRFDGKYYRGSGDLEYLTLLEKARRMFEPDPELQNLSMLYEPKWNGLVEGPTWDAWWIQNSYGTTYG